MKKPIPRGLRGTVLLLAALGSLAAAIRESRLPAEYRATARIKTERSSATGLSAADSASGLSPVAVGLNAIQSDALLGEVITNLQLERAWSERDAGGRRLEFAETLRLLRARLEFHPVPSRSLLDIQATSEKPLEAANLANAVAGTFLTNCLAQHEEATSSFVSGQERQWEDHLKKLERQIYELRRQTNQLHRQIELAIDPAGKSSPDSDRFREYSEVRQKLRDLEDSRKVLMNTIVTNHMLRKLPETLLVEIVDRAVPPSRTVSPNVPLEAGLFGLAALLGLAGLSLLVIPARPASRKPPR